MSLAFRLLEAVWSQEAWGRCRDLLGKADFSPTSRRSPSKLTQRCR